MNHESVSELASFCEVNILGMFQRNTEYKKNKPTYGTDRVVERQRAILLIGGALTTTQLAADC